MTPSDDAPEQGRLQEYGVDAGPAPVTDDTPTCERCGDELEGDAADGVVPKSRSESATGVVDLARGRERRYLCDECRELERYLVARYHELVDRPGAIGAVAVFCSCQNADEVDVQPVRVGGSAADRRNCSRCGSPEVVVEELPPDGGPAALREGEP